MRNLSFGERLSSAGFSALFGLLIGAILTWLLGVYSQTLGPSDIDLNAKHLIFGTSAVFALLGFILGSNVGTIIGSAFSWLYEFERQDHEFGLPTWLKFLVITFIAIGIFWLLSR
jgi:hypothetical protein